MSGFIRGLLVFLAWLVIIAGWFMTGGTNPPRWQGVAVCAPVLPKLFYFDLTPILLTPIIFPDDWDCPARPTERGRRPT